VTGVFQRLDRTRVDDHHGLGLSIVRAIAIAHDATLTANARAQDGLSIESTSASCCSQCNGGRHP
jgi:K+-sensing histidine kinase KdpD